MRYISHRLRAQVRFADLTRSLSSSARAPTVSYLSCAHHQSMAQQQRHKTMTTTPIAHQRSYLIEKVIIDFPRPKMVSKNLKNSDWLSKNLAQSENLQNPTKYDEFSPPGNRRQQRRAAPKNSVNSPTNSTHKYNRQAVPSHQNCDENNNFVISSPNTSKFFSY